MNRGYQILLRVAPRADVPALNPMISSSIKKNLPGEVLAKRAPFYVYRKMVPQLFFFFFFFFLFYLDHLVAFELKRSNYLFFK